MEGKMRTEAWGGFLIAAGIFVSAPWHSSAAAQEQPATGQAEISLRRSVQSRPYQGREVEGEERQIGPGDTLWRILVREKGLPGQSFRSYLVVIRGLNPQIKDPQVLRVGDKLFIPLRPDQLSSTRPVAQGVSERPTNGRGATINYRVKAGEHLYQILREQLKLTDERKVAQYYALVKDLNPERKSWDTLSGGDVIRLPSANPTSQTAGANQGSGLTQGATTAKAEARPAVENRLALDRRQAMQAPAREQMVLFTQVAEALGGELQNSGEELVALKDGNIRLDKGNYPVIFSPALRQRVVIDPDGKIPASLRAKLADPSVGRPIVPMANGVSIREAVGQLLAGLGYQSLPADRPVTIQEEGISYEARGGWTALAPEQSNKTQEVYVISLTEESGEIPDYLKNQLQKNGLHLKDIVLSGAANPASAPANPAPQNSLAQVKSWPRDKREMVDALLLSFGVSFGVGENVSVQLRDGLRLEARTDRHFELAGRKNALFFQRPDPEIVKALQETQGIRAIELDLAKLSSREVIGRVLTLLGDQGGYREHRFAAANGAAKDRLTVAAWGFHLPRRSMFVTDRQIPAGLHRFFFEKGLEIVYFQ